MKYLLLLSLLMVSCDGPDDSNPRALTAASFSNPQTIGTLPDGREVKLIVRNMGNSENHFIYFVGDTATTNYSVPQGKSHYNQVLVEINGVKYVPVENTNEKD